MEKQPAQADPPAPAVSFFGGNGHRESLLLSAATEAATQPELALVSELAQERLATAPEHGTFTGERFFKQRPEAYREIVELLAHPDVSIRRIAKVYHVSQDTVRAIARREGVCVSALRSRLRDACTAGALGLAERIADDPEAFPKSSLPIAIDVLTRNALLLDGQATSIVEHRETCTIEDFNAYIDALKNGGGQNGQGGENSGAMRAPAVPGAGPLVEVEADLVEADLVEVDLVEAELAPAPGSGAGSGEKPLQSAGAEPRNSPE